jgi:hypothetical protein
MDFRQFELYLESQNLAETTINAHMRNIKKIAKVGLSQKLMVKKLNEYPTWGTRLSAANTLSKYLVFKNQPNEEIVKYIHEANAEIQKESQIRQKDMALDDTLPSLKEMKAHMNSLFEIGNYRGYAIMYLFLTYTLRNQDLIATVVKSKKDTNNSDNFFLVGRKRVIYLRNKYKTADKYGSKSHVITNPKFHTAISKLDHLLKETDNIDRVIKKITADIGEVTESTILKIVLKYSNNMNNLKKISHNRGTDITTLINSYNIT